MHKNTEMHKLFWTKSCASQMWLSFLFKKHCSCIVTDCFLIIFSPTIWFNSNLLIIIVFISLIYDKTKKPQHEHNTKPLLREDTEVQKGTKWAAQNLYSSMSSIMLYQSSVFAV